MADLSDFLDVTDNRSDAELKALANLVNFCRKNENAQKFRKNSWRPTKILDSLRKENWKKLRIDFSKHYWKPKLRIVKGTKFPYHAYAVSLEGDIEKEGEYKYRKDAEQCARDYAMCLEDLK